MPLSPNDFDEDAADVVDVQAPQIAQALDFMRKVEVCALSELMARD